MIFLFLLSMVNNPVATDDVDAAAGARPALGGDPRLPNRCADRAL